jgi:prepilin-type N-terminal cleavage/methylation domain-containing protein
MRDKSCHAFSLIELLIVTAILLLLAGISLTGLQTARESARRLACAANLRDLGLGLLHHHQALGVLPPSWGGPDSTSTQVWGSPPEPKPYPRPGIGLASGFVMLLPFIGEPTLSDAIAAAGWPFACSALYASARLPLLQCPSDPSPRSHTEAVVNDRFAVSFSDQPPAACLASFTNGSFRPGTTLFIMNYSPGWLWSFGRPSHVSFSTVLPPNAPRCGDMETQGSLTPQSLHPGGVFGLMADGAVRFIADDIDAGDPALPDRQTGPSPYGVWGAIGSRAGTEVAALPLP